MINHRDPQSENALTDGDGNHSDWPIIPHEVLDCADCCGCLVVEVKGGQAEIRCNECAELIRTVPVSEAERTMAELAGDR